LGAVLDVSRPAPPLGELVAHHAGKDVRARLEPEHIARELNRSRLLGVERGDVGLHYSWLPASACAGSACASDFADSLAASPDPLRKAPGFGAASGNVRFTASRSSTQPPLAPGTAPRIMIRPRFGSVFTTRKFCVVMFTSPIWPAIFLPLN